MLPKRLRFWLFDHLSVKTMRYVKAVPARQAEGLVARVYGMISDDFFKNGSLTSRSPVPALMAAIWVAGRESMLVEDRVDRTTKDALCAVLSQVNDCPYCEDMLVSLVHAGDDHRAADEILSRVDQGGTDETLRARLDWTRAAFTPGAVRIPPAPFTSSQMPEVLATLMAMSDINRFSHVVMGGSPLDASASMLAAKSALVRLFGTELRYTRRRMLAPGLSLDLLPPADLPEDMAWARANPRVADALARWTATVETEAEAVISPAVRRVVERSLGNWQGEAMPISRAWVEAELEGLDGPDRAIARLAIVLAKAPYQVDETLADAVVAHDPDEARFVRTLAWASFTAARWITGRVARESVLAPAPDAPRPERLPFAPSLAG